MAMCIRCGQPAPDTLRPCPACEPDAPALAQAEFAPSEPMASATESSATAARSWPALTPAALASASWRLPPGAPPPRFRRARIGSGSRWGLTAAGFVGLVVVATSAMFGLATHGGARARPGFVLQPVSAPAGLGVLALGAQEHQLAAEHAPHPAPPAPAVTRFVRRYFAALSGHHYRAYRLLLSPGWRARQTRAAFDARYGGVTETAVALRSIAPMSSGQLAVQVSYIRYQRRSHGRSCADWQSLLRLARSGGSYQLTSASTRPARACQKHHT